MNPRSIAPVCAAAALLFVTLPATALDYGDELRSIQRGLRDANQKPDKAQAIAALEPLEVRAHALAVAFVGRAEPLVWEAVVFAALAGRQANMGALSLIKKARASLEAAEKLDARVLDWSAYCLLGQMYWRVPGWPVGFGDKQRAQQLFERAIAQNPTGAEPRQLYGLFLTDQKRFASAVEQFTIALNAPLRVGTQPDESGLSCNAWRCQAPTADGDTRFRTGVQRALAKAQARMK